MKAVALIFLFAISTFVGLKVIGNVPSLLHTPLMSGTNALSGVTLLGALVAAAFAVSTSNQILGAAAIILATINVVGGFLITDKMLKMFKSGSDCK